MNALWNDFRRFWLESRGRNRPVRRLLFQDTEIVTAGEVLQITAFWGAAYLNLHPTVYAVAIAPDGRIVHLKGGYNSLAPGRYILHYVDRKNRASVIPKISETTIDGSYVSLEVVITYRVTDPIRALEIQHPVDTLLFFVQSDLKELVRSHRYDDIVGALDVGLPDSTSVERYIRDQHANRHLMSKLFAIVDIVVSYKAVDPKLTEISEKSLSEQRQNMAGSELLQQNQDLQVKIAAQEAELRKIKASADVEQQEILQKMQLQKIELEATRLDLKLQQEKVMRAMDAIGQAFSSSAYPTGPEEVEIIRELLSTLKGTAFLRSEELIPVLEGSTTAESNRTLNSEKVDRLTETLLLCLDRNRQERGATSEEVSEGSNKSRSKKKLSISVAYPKLFSKRYASTFLVQIYLPRKRLQASQNIRSNFGQQEIDEHLQLSSLEIGQKIKIGFFSPVIDFPEPVIKVIDDALNKVVLLGMPKDACEPGAHHILISISDADTNMEIESLTIKVRVVDFAFDHISRPVVSRGLALVLGIGSFAMFILTFLEQIDKTIGLTSGAAAGTLALGIYASFYNLYQRIRPNTP